MSWPTTMPNRPDRFHGSGRFPPVPRTAGTGSTVPVSLETEPGTTGARSFWESEGERPEALASQPPDPERTAVHEAEVREALVELWAGIFAAEIRAGFTVTVGSRSGGTRA